MKRQVFSPGLKSSDVVQTAATFEGLYVFIPNDEGAAKANVEAVE